MKWLNKIGILSFSLNVEVWDAQAREEIIRTKNQCYSGPQFIDYITVAKGVVGTRRVQSLIIVGLESAKSTLRGVKAIMLGGGMPVLSPYSSEGVTKLPDSIAEPSFGVLEQVYLGAVELSEEHGVPLAPMCGPCGHNTLAPPHTASTPHVLRDEPDFAAAIPGTNIGR